VPVFQRDEEKAAQKAAEKAERERQQAEQAWWASPTGQARAARENGQKVFQISVPLHQTERSVWGTLSGDPAAKRQKTSDPIGPIEQIEAQGWTLAHAGYVFRETGSVSRDKLLSSGQTAQVTGEVVGIYLFRADPDFQAPPGSIS
jgi:hypothetical protein